MDHVSKGDRECGRIRWPEGKRFAFTVFDDTDLATLDNVGPVYDFLADLGFRTTKSVWPLQGPEDPVLGGSTCQDPEYRSWLVKLKERGFELALHNATYHTSHRQRTISGVEQFKRMFGHYPKSLTNHAYNAESIYWGEARLTGINALAYSMLTWFRNVRYFRGHVRNDALFWGDVCKQKVKYVRNFCFDEINTLKVCPYMPYHDPARPYVNYWFSASEGADVESFNQMLSPEKQDRLEEEGGACLMYTHFASGFVQDTGLNRLFKQQMERLAEKQGWFVPISTLLDYIIEIRGHCQLGKRERMELERRWLLHQLKTGTFRKFR
jgi:hypothetical protein